MPEPWNLPTGPIRLISRREYLDIVDAGVFDPDEPIELIEGVVYRKIPTDGPHGRIAGRIIRRLVTTLDDRWDVLQVCAYEATAWSMPEPDITIAPTAAASRPTDARLVIEIADSSLTRDRYKARIYAQSGVPEYWIVNLRDRVVEVHRSPRANAYTKVSIERAGARLTSSAFPELTLVLDDDVFPPDAEPAAVSRRPPRRPSRPRRSPAGRTRSR